jgi:hypothetical protein
MKEIGLSEAVRAVRAELEAARLAGADEDIRFEVGPIEIEFEVAVTREAQAGGKVKVWVVEAGAEGTVGKSTTHRVALTLNPTTAKGPLEIGDQLPGRSR